jgi:hypothetical protein
MRTDAGTQESAELAHVLLRARKDNFCSGRDFQKSAGGFLYEILSEVVEKEMKSVLERRFGKAVEGWERV